ncbi:MULTISPECIES: cytosine permease [unclassified Pseudomonas]|uniref:cytosine permease n=1 Tax=unclassified Pseudomonas TaxID=196821 RepID=UPI000CD03D08|nr:MULTISPECIES: cytosine permease [unclassified Pseudomonas]POA52333.1 cytosine permease [Pseudomonas sp. FW507-12TSA]
MTQHAPGNDYPLSEVPQHARKGLASMAMVLLGFTFFTATMFAGGKLGVAYDFPTLLAVIVLGNLLLGLYAAILGYIAFSSGLNSALMGRFCFGERGSKLSDLILGFTQIGWYAWGTATAAVVLGKYFQLDQGAVLGLMLLFGMGFCATAYIGYRGLELLSWIAVPAMGLLLVLSLWTATEQVGGLDGLLARQPSGALDLSTAITLVFGTFVSGATQATNWTRFSRSAKVAIRASLIGFFIGNGLMVLIGAYGAIVYQQPDVVEVLLLQGFAMAAMAMLLLNIWSTQDNTIYNFAVAGCNLLRTDRRKTVTLVGAVIGALLAMLGMYDLLVPYLILLGTVIPPIGGVIMADFFYRWRGRYPRLAQSQLPAWNWPGLGAYGLGTLAAFCSPWVAPLVGIGVASLGYVLFRTLLGGRAPIAADTA